MSSWVLECKKYLKLLRKLVEKKDKDRLDCLRVMDTSIIAVQRGSIGWAYWIRNPSTMADFSLEDLREISDKLSKFAQSFIEYDAEITERMERKIPKKVPKTVRPTGIAYVA